MSRRPDGSCRQKVHAVSTSCQDRAAPEEGGTRTSREARKREYWIERDGETASSPVRITSPVAFPVFRQ